MKPILAKLRPFVMTAGTAVAGFFKALRLPKTDTLRRRLRENAVWKNGVRLATGTYGRLVTRGEYMKRDFIAIFVIAIMIGMAAKSIATSTVTIGFEDYKLAPKETLYDLNAMQKRLIERGGVSVSSDIASGGACSE